MTIPQIAEASGLSAETVRAKGKELFPHLFANGKKTTFSQFDAVRIMAELRKKGFIQPTENLEVPTENLEVSRIDRLESMVEKLCLAVATMPQAIASAVSIRPALPDIQQDYFTIKAFASRKGQSVAYSEALALGRAAKALSVQHGKEIRKADDERFGVVNSYHVSILDEVFRP